MGRLSELLEQNGHDSEDFDEAICLDELDEACVAVTDDCKLVYDYDLIIQTLIRKWNLTKEDAVDYVDFNIVNARYGDQSPIIVYKLYHNKGDETWN